MKYRLLILFLLCTTLSFSQSAKQVLISYEKEFAKSRYMKYTTKYILYKGHKSEVQLESYSGKFMKNKENDVYIKANVNEVISNKQIHLTISNQEKVMFLEKAKPYSSGEFDISQILPYFRVEPVEKRNGDFFIKLTSTPASGLPYSRIELLVNKSFQLVKQVYYFSTAYNLSGNVNKPEYVYPRLEIQNSGFNFEPIAESLFKTETYIDIKGKSVTSKLKPYKIIDWRVRK